MSKARRKEQVDQLLKFPEPREGLPEDPRPFIGSQHLIAAASVQEWLSGRSLVAVVGRLGSGKSTVCLRAANSRWARQWFLQDEGGQPVHRRFWVDLEDCAPGAETQERVAHVLGRRSFPEALARMGNGRPCLVILDNADRALAVSDDTDTWAQLVACVGMGASVVVGRRSISDLPVERPWTDIIEVPGFGSDEEAKQLFDQLAPQHAADFRASAIVAACDRLPLAVNLLGNAAAGADLEVAHLRIDPATDTQASLDFVVEVTAAMLEAEDRLVWGALSLFPAGLSADDIGAVLSAVPDARERTIRLFSVGVAQRCEAGVRIPLPLRLTPSAAGMDPAAVADMWRSYVGWAQALVGPVPAVGGGGPAGSGMAAAGSGGPAGSGMAAAGSGMAAAGSGMAADQKGRGGRRERSPQPRTDSQQADTWLSRQYATLGRLASQPSLPGAAFDLACAGLLIHRSSNAPDALDRRLVGMIETTLNRSSQPGGAASSDDTADGTDGHDGTANTGGTDETTGTDGIDGTDGHDGTANTGGTDGTDGRGRVDEADRRARVDAEAQAAQVAAALEFQRRFGTAVLVANALARSYHRAGDAGGEAEALCQIGRAERLWAHYDEAETHLAQAHQLYDDLGDGVGQGCALFEIGQVALDRGQLDDAEVHLEEALEMFAANRRPVGQANTNLELVRVDLAKGRLDSAERRLGDALDCYEQAADRLGFANACLQLGQVELARGRLDSAERHFGGALDGYEQAADKVGFANACLQLGQVELARGRLDTAQRRFGGALAGYELVGDKVGLANAALQLGQIDLARGRLGGAGQRLRQALTAYEELGDRIGAANALLQLGQVNLGQGDLDEAERCLGSARWAYDAIGDVAGSANSRHVTAMLRQAQGRRTDALALFGEAARLYSSVGRTASAGWSLAGAARTCSGRAERIGYVADAVRLLHDAGQDKEAAKLAVDLAEPPPKPPPQPAVKRDSHPAHKPEPEPPSEPWPRVITDTAPDAATPDAATGAASAETDAIVPTRTPDTDEAKEAVPTNEAPEAEQRAPVTEPSPAVAEPSPAVIEPSPTAAEPSPTAAVMPEVTEDGGPAGRDMDTELSDVSSLAEPAPEPIASAASSIPPDKAPGADPAPPPDPQLEWSPHWSDAFEAIESAPLGEWKGPWSAEPAESEVAAADPAIERLDVSIWREPPTDDPAPSAGRPPLGDWSTTKWSEVPADKAPLGEWSPAKWTGDPGESPPVEPEADDPSAEEATVPATTTEPTDATLFPGDDETESPPEDPLPDEGQRKGRFRWGRRKERHPDPPTLPGLEP